MKILLACSAGMSTSILEKKMNDYCRDNNLDISALAVPSTEAKSVIQEYDVVLLGPQVGFMKSSFEKIAQGVPVAIIPYQVYGLGKAKETIELAKSLLK